MKKQYNSKSLQSFEIFLKQEKLAINSIKSYLCDLRIIEKLYPLEIKDPFSTTGTKIINYFEKIQTSKNTRSYNRQLISLAKYYSFHKNTYLSNQLKQLYINERFTSRDVVKDTKKLFHFVDALPESHHLEVRNKVIIDLLIYTGLKPQQLVQLKVSDFKLVDSYIELHLANNKLSLVPIHTKTTELIAKYLKSYRNQFITSDLPYFLISKKGKMVRGSIWRIVELMFKHSNFKQNINPNTLRNTLIKALVDKGVDKESICQCMNLKQLELSEFL
jgi:site-specific recombinase XerD